MKNLLLFFLFLSTDTVNLEVLILELLTDEFPEETSWSLTDEAGNVLFSGNGFDDGYEMSTQLFFSFNLPAEGCYLFTIFDSAYDGICCGFGQGSYRLLSGDGELLAEGGDFGISDQFNFTAAFGGIASDDAAILNIDFDDTSLACGGTPGIRVLNSGAEPITSLQIATLIGSNIMDTINWVGNIPSGEVTVIDLDRVILLSPVPVAAEILLVNNQPDNNSFRNSANFTIPATATRARNSVLLLELTTDDFPEETTWELLDENGNTLFSGDGNDYGPAEEFSFFLPVPGDGCYEFAIFDSAEDGICCGFGLGEFRLSDAFGNLLHEGGNFFAEDRAQIFVRVDNQPANDAAIVSLSIDENSSMCGVQNFEPELVIANIGTSDITALDYEVTLDDGSTTLESWSGNLSSGMQETIILNQIDGTLTDSVAVNIINVNGQTDNSAFKNDIKSTLRPNFLLAREETEFTLEMQLDSFAYEVYWEITNSTGDVVAFGGNETVGPDGAGLGVATPSDPGAYASDELVLETFTLPLNDCYQFTLVDDFADGIDFPNNPFFDFRTSTNSLLFIPLSFLPFSELNFELETLGNAISTDELITSDDLNIFPNPTSGDLNIEFTLSDNSYGNINVLNLLGKRVHTITNQVLNQGKNQLQIDMSYLTDGIYFLQISAEGKQTTRKFQVMK